MSRQRTGLAPSQPRRCATECFTPTMTGDSMIRVRDFTFLPALLIARYLSCANHAASWRSPPPRRSIPAIVPEYVIATCTPLARSAWARIGSTSLSSEPAMTSSVAAGLALLVPPLLPPPQPASRGTSAARTSAAAERARMLNNPRDRRVAAGSRVQLRDLARRAFALRRDVLLGLFDHRLQRGDRRPERHQRLLLVRAHAVDRGGRVRERLLERIDADRRAGRLLEHALRVLFEHGRGVRDHAVGRRVQRLNLIEDELLVGQRLRDDDGRPQRRDGGRRRAVDAFDQLLVVVTDQVEREVPLHVDRLLGSDVDLLLARVEEHVFLEDLHEIGR